MIFSEGPYYGVESSIETHTNYGGVDVNTKNQVLNEDGDVIDHLFASGEVARSSASYTYQACIHQGRLAAQVAVEEYVEK